MVTWSAFRNNSEVNGLYDVESVQSANPFGDYAILKFDDFDGTKFDNFKFGDEIKTEVEPEENPELTISSGNTFSNSGSITISGTVLNSGTFSNQGTVLNQADELSNFLGFAADINTIEQNGADKLEINAYSFDQFLRRNDVSNDQSGKTISNALEDIIKTDTPITWNASNVDVQDDRQITLSLQDERVETALLILSFKSENEGFGVNAEKEFFFRPRETKHIDRGIGPSEYFNYDIPERGRDSINEIELRYDNGTDAVVVDNGDEKLNLEENLNLDDPGTRRERVNRPNITNASDAESEARRILKLRNSTLTGTITTFGLFNAEPFDTININIPDRGIDDEFVITKVEYFWGRDETRLTIVENKGTDDDVIVRLSEKTERIDLRDSDPDANINRVVSTGIDVIVNAQADFDGTSATDFKTTNTGRGLVRDGWNGNGSLNITEIAVGTDNANLSRSNTTLANEVARKSVNQTTNTFTVDFDASFSQTDIAEAGLFNQNGDLITRVILDSPTDVSGTVQITLSGKDGGAENGSLLDTGRKAIKSIISGGGGTSPPSKFAFGTDGTKPTTSDTSLGNKVITTNIGEVDVIDVDTTTEWTDYQRTSLDQRPLGISNGKLKLLQTSFTEEGEFADVSGSSGAVSNSAASNTKTEVLAGNSGEFVSFNFTPAYEIPAGEFECHVRAVLGTFGSNDVAQFEIFLNGNSLGTRLFGSSSRSDFDWYKRNTSLSSPPKLAANTQHTVRVQEAGLAGDEDIEVDVVAPVDDRFNYTFDNSTGSNDELDGPELYPSQITQAFDPASPIRIADGTKVSSTWNDTSNNQFIELSPDDNTYDRTTNSDSASTTFSDLTGQIYAKVGLSRFGTDTDTPATGVSGQEIELWNLDSTFDGKSPEAIGETEIRGAIDASNIQGKTIKEAGQVNPNGDLATRVVFADIDVDSQIDNLISADSVTFRPD